VCVKISCGAERCRNRKGQSCACRMARIMKQPSHECTLTEKLCIIDYSLPTSPGSAAVVATRVCALARTYRKLNVARCNRELTDRETHKMESVQRRADDLLRPYGLCMDHPYGLCMYALPIGNDCRSSSQMTVIA
jgi:hypothetical protein